MQTAKGFVVLCPENKQFKTGITPAEALILYKLHFKHSNGSPLEGFVLDGEATETVNKDGKKVTRARTNAEECARLKRKYSGLVEGKRAFEAVFGTGTMVKLPASFEDIAETIEFAIAAAPEADTENPAPEEPTHEWTPELEAEYTALYTTHKPNKAQRERLEELEEYKATAANRKR